MKILIIGEPENFYESKQKLGETHEYTTLNSLDDLSEGLNQFNLIFDFLIEEELERVQYYLDLDAVVFLNTVKITLAEISYLYGGSSNIVGFNGLRTFVNRNRLEISSLNNQDQRELNDLFTQLDIEYSLVDDRVGMVTPRVVLMIINEAYYTVQEGTASRADIDLGMKLGTNYPLGPFEWAEKIGIRDIYETLEAIYDDTKEERYKICPLLKKEYLLQKT